MLSVLWISWSLAATPTSAELLAQVAPAFERGDVGLARTLVDTVASREGPRVSRETSYWRRLLRVAHCETDAPARHGNISERLLDLESARGRRFRNGESPDGTVWAHWLSKDARRGVAPAIHEGGATWRAEPEIWPDEIHVRETVRNRCHDSNQEHSQAPTSDDEVVLTRDLLSRNDSASLRATLSTHLVARLLATERRDEARAFLSALKAPPAVLQIAHLILTGAPLSATDRIAVAKIAHDPSHPGAPAAAAKLLASLSIARDIAALDRQLKTLPPFEALGPYRTYLRAIVFDAERDGAVWSFVAPSQTRCSIRNARCEKPPAFGPYATAVEALLVRRASREALGGAPLGAIVKRLLASARPSRRGERIDSLYRQLGAIERLDLACGVADTLFALSPHNGRRCLLECAVFNRNTALFAERMKTLVDEFTPEESLAAIRSLVPHIADVQARLPPDGRDPTVTFVDVVEASLRILEPDLDNRSVPLFAEIKKATRQLRTSGATSKSVGLARIVLLREPLLLPPPTLSFFLPEPRDFLLHRSPEIWRIFVATGRVQ